MFLPLNFSSYSVNYKYIFFSLFTFHLQDYYALEVSTSILIITWQVYIMYHAWVINYKYQISIKHVSTLKF